jgi:hypothetical protein
MASVRGMGVALIISRWVPCRAPLPFCCAGQPLRHAKAVLLVDDGQRQLPELHLILDHGVRSDHQRRLAAGHQFQHGVRSFFFCPPVSQATLATRRKAAAPASRSACESAARPGFRSAPSAHIASPHRSHIVAANAATTVLPDPTSPCSNRCMGTWRNRSRAISSPTLLLRRSQLERQAASSCCNAGLRAWRLQHRRSEHRALTPAFQLRKLLRQQLFGLQALPGWMAVRSSKCGQRHIGRGLVQEGERIAQGPQGAGGRSFPRQLGSASCQTGRREPIRQGPPFACRPAAPVPRWDRQASARWPVRRRQACRWDGPSAIPGIRLSVSPRMRSRVPTAIAFCCDG